MLFLLENTDTHKHSHKALHSYEPGRDILKGVDQLKANLSSQQTRSQELAKIRAALVDGDAVEKLNAEEIRVMDQQLRASGYSAKAKTMLPLGLFEDLKHKAALQLRKLCFPDRHLRAEKAQLDKFSEFLQAFCKASIMKELHGTESEDVLKDRQHSTQRNVCFVCLSFCLYMNIYMSAYIHI